MKILLVNKFAHVTGGADTHCLEIADALRARDHEVRVLSTRSERNIEGRGRFVRCITTNAARKRQGLWESAGVGMRAVWHWEAARAMSALIDDFRPDVVHTHKLYPQLSVAPVIVAARRGVPIVQTIHDYEFVSADPFDAEGGKSDRSESERRFRALNSALFGIKRRYHTPRIDHWIAVSRFVATRYEEAGIKPMVLKNFVTEGHPPRRFDERSGAIFVGRLVENKGVTDVIRFARARPDVPVRIVGDGALRAKVESAARETPNLDYLGNLGPGDVRRAMASARVTLMPSLWPEPGPIVALESMACGTPIVAYDSGGLGEYVTDAKCGYAVEPSARSLIAAASSLVNDSPRWMELSAASVAAWRRFHSVDAYIEALVTIYSLGSDARTAR